MELDATVELGLIETTHPEGFRPLRRVLVNVTSLLTSDVLNRAATFAVYAMVARYCGAHSFGQLSLGLMLLYTFQVFASAGLPTLLTREIAKNRAATGLHFANATVIALMAAVFSIAGLWLFVVASRYPADTRAIVMLLGAAVLPWALTTISESVFRAWEQMHLIVLVAIPINIAKVATSYYLLSTGHGVQSIALVFLACHTTTLLIEWWILFRHLRLTDVAIDIPFCRQMVSQTWRFLGIDSLIAVWGSINTVLISWFVGEAAVGLFVAAWQLLVPVWLALQAVDNSLFPMMCRRAEGDPQRFRRLTVLLLEVLTMVAVPGCVLLYFGADFVISTVYGHQEFAESVNVLRIMLPVLLLHAAASTFGQVLYSNRREHVTLRIVAVDVVFNIFCGLLLISTFGLTGAALTALATWTLNGVLHFIAAHKQLRDETGDAVQWGATLIAPVLVAGGIMAIAMAMMSNVSFVAAAVITSLIYLGVLAAMIYGICRGSLGVRERFLGPLLEVEGVVQP